MNRARTRTRARQLNRLFSQESRHTSYPIPAEIRRSIRIIHSHGRIGDCGVVDNQKAVRARSKPPVTNLNRKSRPIYAAELTSVDQDEVVSDTLHFRKREIRGGIF